MTVGELLTGTGFRGAHLTYFTGLPPLLALVITKIADVRRLQQRSVLIVIAAGRHCSSSDDLEHPDVIS
jgi:hypothetical protein